jgi:hypothetical protein
VVLPPTILSHPFTFGTDVPSSDHFVQFFDADDQLVDAVGRFVHTGIEAGEVCVVIATAEHRRRIAAELAVRGIDVAALEADYRYIAVDADTLLNGFFSNGRLDRYRFHDRVGMLQKQAASSGRPVRVFGEMVALLVSRGHVPVAIELEDMWNELGRSQEFVLLCGYSRAVFTGPLAKKTMDRICAMHTHSVIGASQVA